MPKVEVLHIIDTLGVGGAERVMVGTINSLPEFSHHVVYLTGKDTLAAELPSHCKVTCLNFRFKLDIPRCVIAIRRYIKQNNIEVVHSHLVMSTLISRLATPRKVKQFNSIHNLLSHRCFTPEKKFPRFVEKFFHKKHQHIIAVSESVKEDYDKTIGIKGEVTVLPNFVEPHFFADEFKRMNFNGTFRMVAVGSMKWQKNYEFLIEAFKQMPKNIHLDIYGDGPLRGEIENAIKKHNLNIKLCGLQSNVHERLRQYDMFVMSSHIEGHPVALLEAMASGMPAILSDIPVLREATRDKAIYFNLDNTTDFINKITAIAAHQVNLDEYARTNFEMVRQVAGKKQYMQSLRDLYTNRGNHDRIVKASKDSQPVFTPALNLQTS
jgi:glycosyltransferase involved in cell wall biosynthesis